MGRILSIDYGAKRTGLAVSDELQISIKTLPQMETQKPEFWKGILAIIEEYNPEIIILGYPQHDLDQINPIQKSILDFKNRLTKDTNIPVLLQDESYTSEEAAGLQRTLRPKSKRNIKKDKAALDSYAAAILLRQYLKDPV